MNKPIYVTQPSLPPLEEFTPYLEKIWEKRILTNCGPMHEELEGALCSYLGVKHVSLFNNGTIALVTALQVAGLKGEVITTPFSFVATANSLIWNNLTPVFVDIDEQSFNIDPAKIEAAITPDTTAILAVHCYGNPCDAAAIQAIADQHGLKVIYDAAHAFGTRTEKGSLLNEGDLSAISFHATKVFNTFEGGAVISHDPETKKAIDSCKNFGIVDELRVEGVGLNGKMSEINAAFGLVQLNYIDEAITKREAIDQHYREGLEDIEGIICLDFQGLTQANYAYFPIRIKAPYPLSRDALFEKMKDFNIFARRYFYPLISDFTDYRTLPSAGADKLPIATKCAEQVLCLPMSAQMSIGETERVLDVIRSSSDRTK
jgi:dTDP-4-amino-4,6-dideoxygalactose transaminase